MQLHALERLVLAAAVVADPLWKELTNQEINVVGLVFDNGVLELILSSNFLGFCWFLLVFLLVIRFSEILKPSNQ
jgi:hypothetical protein